MENSNSSALSDGSQQANIVSNENAETMFGADQGETNMVKLVDGKLTPIGNTDDDVADEQLRNRYSSDEERSLQGEHGKTYENSAASLRVDGAIDENEIPNDPIADAELTGNPDAGDTVNTGLPLEDAPRDSTEKGDATPTGSFVGWATPIGSGDVTVWDSVPTTPAVPSTPPSPDPTQPVPGIPETPPTPPVPGPEIPDLPGTPKPAVPEIQEPSEPDRSHEINADRATAYHHSATDSFLTYTAEASGLIDEGDVALDNSSSAPGDPDDEGMEETPDTGDSAHPYDVNAKDADVYQPGERPEEKKQTQQMPREMLDESSVTAQDMISGTDRSDQKSTDGLDRKYNDPEAAREMAS